MAGKGPPGSWEDRLELRRDQRRHFREWKMPGRGSPGRFPDLQELPLHWRRPFGDYFEPDLTPPRLLAESPNAMVVRRARPGTAKALAGRAGETDAGAGLPGAPRIPRMFRMVTAQMNEWGALIPPGSRGAGQPGSGGCGLWLDHQGFPGVPAAREL